MTLRRSRADLRFRRQWSGGRRSGAALGTDASRIAAAHPDDVRARLYRSK